MNDEQFRQLLDYFGYSWQGYRKVRKGVIKRLHRHMQQLDIHDAADYIARIQSVPEIRREVRRLMTVSISRFFRDPPLWECIKRKLIPDILSRHPALVKVWFAGCALGQEAYSMKMLWLLLQEESGPLPPLSLTATDINQEYLDMAIAGVYSNHITREVPRNYLEKFFRCHHGEYFIKEEVKQNISWQLHDLIDTSPVNGPFHMIFLRNNLLTYYKREFQEDPIHRFTEALITGGYLIIGAREELFVTLDKIARVDDYPGIFQKQPPHEMCE
ncbi:MAG: hypothetical protein JW902_14550 [Syntrophaceae bacterium]|nr:hypothetical protein [Syntrophaceae bacterium]